MVLVTVPVMIAEPPVHGRDPRIGILFILLSCIVQGAQYVLEEEVMSIEGVEPLLLIGTKTRLKQFPLTPNTC
jgi:hypothetical protein